MSCRASVVPPGPAAEHAAQEVAEVCVDLARAGRREDFCWLLEARGLPVADIEALWRRVRLAVRSR